MDTLNNGMSLLDDVDLKILDILKEDSRTPFTKIASMLGVSDSTIHVRLKKLREEGVLLKYTVALNEEVLGTKVHGLAMINVTPSHIEDVIPQLTTNPRISKVYETHGSNDLIALLDAGDLDELRELMVEIRHIKNIVSTALTTILKIWK